MDSFDAPAGAELFDGKYFSEICYEVPAGTTCAREGCEWKVRSGTRLSSLVSRRDHDARPPCVLCEQRTPSRPVCRTFCLPSPRARLFRQRSARRGACRCPSPAVWRVRTSGVVGQCRPGCSFVSPELGSSQLVEQPPVNSYVNALHIRSIPPGALFLFGRAIILAQRVRSPSIDAVQPIRVRGKVNTSSRVNVGTPI